MSDTTTANNWAIEQADIFDKLDVSFTVILIVSGILTFPPACFVYWKILTLESFKKQYLMKLFVLNGASNMLIYLVNLIAVQFCNWPSMFVFYAWLKDSLLSLVLRFLQDFSMSVMWQTTFFISLNRLLSLKNQHFLTKHDFRFFVLASASSLAVSTGISVPLLFSQYTYVQFPLGDGQLAFIPQIPRPMRMTANIVNEAVIAYFITLTIAVATTLPFWTMMIFAHSMRRAVLSGTGFDSFIAVRGSAKTRPTASAHF